MKKQATIQYTIRGIPPEVDQALRKKAAQKKISLNQVLVDELTTASGQPKKYADFSDLVGKWQPDPEFDALLEEQRQIDWDMWK